MYKTSYNSDTPANLNYSIFPSHSVFHTLPNVPSLSHHPPPKMTKILLILLATLAAALASQHETNHHHAVNTKRALPTTITADLATISKDLHSLTSTVNAYNGGILDGLTVMKSERALIKDLESSTANAENLGELSESDAEDLLGSMKGLVPDIEGTLNAIAEKEEVLRSARMHGQAVVHMRKLEGMVERYAEALVKPMPEAEEGEGREVLAVIKEAFGRTLKALK